MTSPKEIARLKKQIAKEKRQIELKKTILHYNILACPKSGVPQVDKKGKFIMDNVNIRKNAGQPKFTKKMLEKIRPGGHRIIHWKSKRSWECSCGEVGYGGVSGAKKHFDEIIETRNKAGLKIEQ